MFYPLTFHPILMERVWGGRNLERLYQKKLPDGVPIGESWEITDRPEGVSVVDQGSLAGKDLRWLMQHHSAELLGSPTTDPFPLLIKILDAQQTLSVQVHPPPSVAPSLHGEPKTEMWYIAEASPSAELYAGLRAGTTRENFVDAIHSGHVADHLHHFPVATGDAILIPSGRIHAIGAGNVIFEIQQNSNTTYRVFDWNRVGLDGKPRALHVRESLASIDFEDHEPAAIHSKYSRNLKIRARYLVQDPLFIVDAWQVKRSQRFHLNSPSFQILGLLQGRLQISHGDYALLLTPGRFALLPACLERVSLVAETKVEFLHIQPGTHEAISQDAVRQK